MVRKLFSMVDGLSVFMGKLFSFLVLPVMMLEAVEVVLRYVFNSPTDWSWELAAHLSGMMFIMGAGWVLLDDKHVRTDLIYAKLSKRGQALLDVIFFAVIFFSFCGVLTYKSWIKAIYSTQINERTFSMWGPPLFPLKIVIATGFTVLLLQGIVKWSRSAYYLFTEREI